jgi:hypothetical protein
MRISKRLLLTAGTSLVIGLSSAALAQAPAPKSTGKSSQVTTLGEGEAVMIGPKSQRLHKSNSKVTAARHQSAMAKGAKEIPAGAVIYKQGGKLYMLQDSGNEKASQTFQDQFDTDY